MTAPGTTTGATTGPTQTTAQTTAPATPFTQPSIYGSLNAPGVAAPPPGGLQIDLSVSTKLTVDDNYQLQPNSTGTSTFWDNSLGFNLSSVSGINDFTLDASGVYRYGKVPGRNLSGFEDPQLRFRYVRSAVNSSLTLTGRYRHVDREYLDPFQIEQEEQQTGSFLGGGGTLTINNATLDYVTGINDPFSFALSLSHDEKGYDATAMAANNTLFGNTTNSAAATATFNFSKVTALRLQAGQSDYSADDSVRTDRTTTDYSIGIVQDVNPVLLLDAQIGYSEVETTTTGGVQMQDGLIGAVTLTRTMPNGTAFAGLNTTLNENGTSTTLAFGRDLQLPRGQFTAVVGGTHTPSGNVYVTGQLAYTRQLRDSDLTLTVDRGVSTNTVSEDVLDTRVALGYGYAINNNSRLSLTLNWGRSESAGIGTAPTIERTRLDAAYSYDLTQDWALTGGVTLRQRSDTSVSGDARSNAVFVSLGRSFNYRP